MKNNVHEQRVVTNKQRAQGVYCDDGGRLCMCVCLRGVCARAGSSQQADGPRSPLWTPTLAAGVAAAALARTIAHRERLLEMHLPTPLRTASTFTCIIGTPKHNPLTVTNTSPFRQTSTARVIINHRDPLSIRSPERVAFSFSTNRRRANKTFDRREPTVDLGRGLARDANGRRRRLRARPDLASRGEDAGIGFGAIPVTKIIGTASAPQSGSEARHDAVGASETRINTRLFTYGARARAAGRGAPAIRALQLLPVPVAADDYILTQMKIK